MTPPNAAECKPAAAPRPVAFKRFDGIDRTRGIIAARSWEQRAQENLVSPNK